MTTAEVLAVLRGHKSDRETAEVRMLVTTIESAALKEVEPEDESGWFGDRAMALAGDGAPRVSEFAAMEYAAALGMTTDSEMACLGRALELRYRLPRLWQSVVDREVPVWRAGRGADQTLALHDALDLDEAITHGARQLAALGSTDSLGVRRSIAAAELARRQLALDLTGDESPQSGRGVMLHVHLSEAALCGVERAGVATRGPRSARSRSASGAATPMPT